jgi:AcrR family transcriptional regulator
VKNTNDLSRRERERLRHREEILGAAKKVFIESGYASATMESIAVESEFSLATLYKFFGSKENLFLEILLQMLEKLEQLTDEIISREDSVKNRAVDLFYARMDLYWENPGLIALIEDVIKNDHTDLSCLEDLKQRYITYINGLTLFFSEGITRGEFKDRGSRMIALAYEGIIDMYFRSCSGISEIERNHQEVANLLSIFVGGAANDTSPFAAEPE